MFLVLLSRLPYNDALDCVRFGVLVRVLRREATNSPQNRLYMFLDQIELPLTVLDEFFVGLDLRLGSLRWTTLSRGRLDQFRLRVLYFHHRLEHGIV